MKIVTISIILVLLMSTAACALDARVYLAPKISAPPTIDGKLGDNVWQRVPPISLVLAETGKPASKKTIARMCWDEKNLYVSFECEDADVWGTYTKRDDPVYIEEVVEIFVSPDCNLKAYYEINVSPRNVVFDSLIGDPVKGSPTTAIATWNCEGIGSAVAVNGTLDNRDDVDEGWATEISMPFACLGRSAPKPGERWRLNLYRIDLKPVPVEFQAWSPTYYDPAAFHIPERFGTVIFTNHQ